MTADPRSVEVAGEVGRELARRAFAAITEPASEGVSPAALVEPYIRGMEHKAAQFASEGMHPDDVKAWLEAVRDAFTSEMQRIAALVRLSAAKPEGTA